MTIVMSKLRAAINLETAFGDYRLDEQLRCRARLRRHRRFWRTSRYHLTQTSSDKRRRFKNEIAFLARNKHANIVTVTDHGVATGSIKGPFYVMRRYNGNLRMFMRRSAPGEVMKLFSQMLDGVEAAHCVP